MKHVESFSPSNFKGMRSEMDFKKREKELSGILRQLPEESREFVTDLTSAFLEKNEYEKVRSSPELISELYDQLLKAGISERKVNKVMRYFNLPVKK